MKVVLFCHSLVSDWNHGNAHFLRGVLSELHSRGIRTEVYEPEDSWSRTNLIAAHGTGPVQEFHQIYPRLRSVQYAVQDIDLDLALRDADLVIVHEWNEPELVSRIGEHRRASGHYRLLFHDTHHRSATAPEQMERYDLSGYDGALVFGEVIRRIYMDRRWVRRAWTWHEAADIRVFGPIPNTAREGDLLWIGNWGDEERTAELEEFVFKPAYDLGLRTRIYGVRYPAEAVRCLKKRNFEYRGWLPNYRAPREYAAHRLTLHVPRRPYTESLPGIPTIRPFEAMACARPLICAPWEDVEALFTEGRDYLTAQTGREMTAQLKRLLNSDAKRSSLGEHARRTILRRHTCGHRVDELLEIAAELDTPAVAELNLREAAAGV